jgi:hypothetical protein
VLKIKTVLSNKTIRYVETKNKAIKREKESGSEARACMNKRLEKEIGQHIAEKRG